MKSHEKFAELAKFISYYAPYKGLMTFNLLSATLAAVLALIFPIGVRYIVSDVLEDTSNIMSHIIVAGVFMLALIIAQTCLALVYDYKGHCIGAKIERDMRKELFEHYQKLPFNFFDNQKTGKLMSILNNDILNLAELYHHAPENLVIYGTQFIGALIILFYINWELALIICVFLPIMGN